MLQQEGQVASLSSFMKHDNRNTHLLAEKKLGILKGHMNIVKARLTLSSPFPQALFSGCDPSSVPPPPLSPFPGPGPPRTSCKGHGLRGVMGRKGQGLEKESVLHTIAPRVVTGEESRRNHSRLSSGIRWAV